MRKMLDAQLKNVPADQKEKILSAFEKNPELFKKIALEIQAETESGVNQMTAAMHIADKYKDEIKNIMGGSENNEIQ
jgi:hypothetical protein